MVWKNKANRFMLKSTSAFVIILMLVPVSNSFAYTKPKIDPEIQRFSDDTVLNLSELNEKITQMIPAQVESHIKLGDDLFRKSMYEKALNHYTMAANIGLEDSEPYYKKAKCLKTMQRYEEAKEAFKQAQELEKK